jgi:hypothetical protein
MTMFLDIFPNARKRLNTSPAETANTVNAMVTRAPRRSEGIHDRIF